MIFNLGYALLGKSLELAEGVHVEVSDGAISHIGRGHVGGAVDLRRGLAMPTLVNAHVHVLDYAFLEYGSGMGIDEVVSEPRGLKHRLLSSLSAEEAAYACRRVFSRLLRSGVGAAVVFSELPWASRAVREEARGVGVDVVVLSRPRGGVGVDEVLREADGLGLDSPLRYGISELAEMRRRSDAMGKLIAVHVAETEASRLRGDFELALDSLRADLVVHGTWLKEPDAEALAQRGVPLVVCPRSNMFFGVGLPPIAELLERGVALLLGTDNAGLVEPDPWREMEVAYYVARMGRAGVSAKEVLKMATVNAVEVKGLGLGSAIEEGREASFVVLDAEELGIPRSRDVYATIVKRGSPAQVLAVVRGERWIGAT